MNGNRVDKLVALIEQRGQTIAQQAADAAVQRALVPAGGLSYSDGVMIRELVGQAAALLVGEVGQVMREQVEGGGEALRALVEVFERSSGMQALEGAVEQVRRTVEHLGGRLAEVAATPPHVTVEPRIDARQPAPVVNVGVDVAPVVEALDRLAAALITRRPTRFRLEHGPTGDVTGMRVEY